MNRITDKDITKACNDTWDLCGLDRVCKRDCYKPTQCMIPHIVYRLAEIEDILGDEYDLKRLREILKAEKDGLCIVLPKVNIRSKNIFAECLEDTFKEWSYSDPSVGLYGMTDDERELADAIMGVLKKRI